MSDQMLWSLESVLISRGRTHETHKIWIGDRDTGIITMTIWRGESFEVGAMSLVDQTTKYTDEAEFVCAVLDAAEEWERSNPREE